MRPYPWLLLVLLSAWTPIGPAQADELDQLVARFVRERGRPYRDRLPVLNRLSTIKGERCLEALHRLYQEEKDQKMVSYLLRKVVRFKGPKVRSVLLNALSSTGNLSLQIAAASNMKYHMDADLTRRAVDLLCAATTSKSLQKYLVTALHSIKDPQSTEWLLTELKKTKKRVRILILLRAVSGLVDSPNALPQILRFTNSKDLDIRIAAHEALGQQSSPQAREVLLRAMNARDPLLAGVAIRALGLHATNDEELTRRLLSLGRSRVLNRQLAAMDALGIGGITAATDLLLSLLDNRRWEIRVGAIQNLRLLRVKEAIGPLIDRLSKEKGRLRGDIVDALEDLTAKTFGFSPGNWRSWWNVHAKSFEVPSKKKEGKNKPKKDDDGGSVSSYYGIRVLSQRVLFLVDISGSMKSPATLRSKTVTKEASSGTNRLDLAKANLIQVLSGFDRKVQFNLVFFDNQYTFWRKKLTPANRQGKEEAIAYTKQQKPVGGTNIYDPLEAGIQMKGVDTIFLLTDGDPGSGKFVNTNDILREIGKLNGNRRIKIHTIALGGHRTLLEKLSRESGGRYVQP